jgi:hypothetical protein
MTQPSTGYVAPGSAPNPYGIEFWLGFIPGPGSTVIDADPTMRVATGRQLLVQSLLCRQTTPVGSVIDCPNDCLDIRDSLSDGMTAADIMALASTVQNELQKDQRVISATVTGTFMNSTLTLVESIQSGYGPFQLVLSVSGVTVQLLNANLPAGS